MNLQKYLTWLAVGAGLAAFVYNMGFFGYLNPTTIGLLTFSDFAVTGGRALIVLLIILVPFLWGASLYFGAPRAWRALSQDFQSFDARIADHQEGKPLTPRQHLRHNWKDIGFAVVVSVGFSAVGLIWVVLIGQSFSAALNYWPITVLNTLLIWFWAATFVIVCQVILFALNRRRILNIDRAMVSVAALMFAFLVYIFGAGMAQSVAFNASYMHFCADPALRNETEFRNEILREHLLQYCLHPPKEGSRRGVDVISYLEKGVVYVSHDGDYPYFYFQPYGSDIEIAYPFLTIKRLRFRDIPHLISASWNHWSGVNSDFRVKAPMPKPEQG